MQTVRRAIGVLYNLKTLTQCILEFIVIGIVRGNIVRNVTGQPVVDILSDPSITVILPVALFGIGSIRTSSVIENLLVDRGNAGLLGDRHGITANNGKDRGGASVRLGRIRKTIRHEEIIAIAVKATIFIRVRARPRLARRKLSRSGLRLNIFLHA